MYTNPTLPSIRENKEKQFNQKAKVIWFTGLPCSGKTTLAIQFESLLLNKNLISVVIDGDYMRKGLNKDLDFSNDGRFENVRRIAEVSRLLINNGIIVIVALISPTKIKRELAKNIIGDDDFIEVYINAPLSTCEKRDVKGMYKKARLGEIKQFTGIDAIYEAPTHPNLMIPTNELSIIESVNLLEKNLLHLLI